MFLWGGVSELYEDDEVGEGGGQEGGDQAAVHCEEPTGRDLAVSPQLQDCHLKNCIFVILVHVSPVTFFFSFFHVPLEVQPFSLLAS